MKSFRIALAASLLTTGAVASAQTANDARCILLSSAYAKAAKDANAQKFAEASFYFYLGRIAPGATATQLKALFNQQTKGLTDATAAGLMDSCAKEFQAKVQLIDAIGGPPPAAATTPKK